MVSPMPEMRQGIARGGEQMNEHAMVGKWICKRHLNRGWKSCVCDDAEFIVEKNRPILCGRYAVRDYAECAGLAELGECPYDD